MVLLHITNVSNIMLYFKLKHGCSSSPPPQVFKYCVTIILRVLCQNVSNVAEKIFKYRCKINSNVAADVVWEFIFKSLNL